MVENDIKIATAEATANAKLSNNSANKVLYIVRVEDPSLPSKISSFAALKLVENTNTLQVIGFDISDNNKPKKNTQNIKVNTYQQALEIAEKGNIQILDMKFPWHRIVSIQNVNYQRK